MSNQNQSPAIEMAQIQPKGFVRLKAVCELLGLSKSTVWSLSKNDPAFPKPVKISPNCTAWRADELNAWIDSRERVQFKGVSNA